MRTLLAVAAPAAPAGIAHKTLTVPAGWERLGGDAHAGCAVQMPLATLHKFTGWADVFLTAPAAGLRDSYADAAYASTGQAGMDAAITIAFLLHCEITSCRLQDDSIAFHL